MVKRNSIPNVNNHNPNTYIRQNGLQRDAADDNHILGKDMAVFERITKRIPIKKGWSADKKYCAFTDTGEKYLLRVSSLDRYEQKKYIFDRVCAAAALDIAIAYPIECGICNEGVYTLESFIDGVDAEDFIIQSAVEKQYTYGLDAGRILSKLHTIPVPGDAFDWNTFFCAKIDTKISSYDSCELKYENGNLFLDYIEQNRHLLRNRPLTYRHGDYQIGNMMIDSNEKLMIIDFEYSDFGDPWEEFKRILWCVQASPFFASGMVDGYFDKNVPMDFWRLLALYTCTSTIGSLPWIIRLGQKEIQETNRQAKEILGWYNNMQNIVPKWYQEKT